MIKKILQEKGQKTLSPELKDLISLVVYSDMYDCAMKLDDLMSFWGVESRVIDKAINQKLLRSKHGFVFLPNRGEIVQRTIAARKIAARKFAESKEILQFLVKLPWVKMVGLSGSIGAKNAKKDDDYDVFLIVDKGSKWVVRFFEYIYYGFVRKNRAFNSNPDRRNKVCANMYLELDALTLPKEKQNLFVAYQALMVEPLYGIRTYIDFLDSNPWINKQFGQTIRTYNVTESFEKVTVEGNIHKSKSLLKVTLNSILGAMQRFKIKISGGDLSKVDLPGALFFHPKDPSQKVIKRFEEKLAKYLE